MASKVKSRTRSSIPVATAIPVAKAIPVKTTNRILSRIKKGGNWMTIHNWLMVSKLITVVGLIIFAISTASGTVWRISSLLLDGYWCYNNTYNDYSDVI